MRKPIKKKSPHPKENLTELVNKAQRLEALINLINDIQNKEKRDIISFNDFLYLASTKPELIFRDIFQLFHDMLFHYISEDTTKSNYSEEYTGLKDYNCDALFVEDCNNPFFADNLFANRLINVVKNLKKGSQHNYIYLFEGPPGSGKSTFLNNLLFKLEEYTKTEQGSIYKVFWHIDTQKINHNPIYKTLQAINQKYENDQNNNSQSESDNQKKYIDFSCPNHDHPILLIPKQLRKKFLNELIQDKKFKEELFTDKEYEWVFTEIPCSLCKSIYAALLENIGNPMEVFNMLYARKSNFNRQFGEGISIFNPGDPIYNKPISNNIIQEQINHLLNTDIRFIYSYLAKTNNGVFALMDIKERNIERLMDLHGIISDGIHKVELIEERIKSLFVGLINPGDKVHYENVPSFQDRIITVNIPYILDYKTEVAIYKNKFGEDISELFLPGVLENFAKIIISTRLNSDSPEIKRWITNPDKYNKYIDKNMLLLKMEIYAGKIPEWLQEEDIQRFDRDTKKLIYEAGEKEGSQGLSGRQSLNVFSNFINKFSKPEQLITMNMLKKFFVVKSNILEKEIPHGFLDSLIGLYDYDVLQQMKEAIYYFNESQIHRDIMNYLFCINFEPDETKKCIYTNDTITITDDYFKNFEAIFLGTTSSNSQRLDFRKNNLSEYITKTLSHEIRIEGKNIKETEQFKTLFEKYTRNLKENALSPYAENENFRRAIIDFNTESFNNYDDRTKRDVKFLIQNLKNKFLYTEAGAKEVCIYILDKKLAGKF